MLTGANTGKGLWDGGATGVLFLNRRNFDISPYTFSELNKNATAFYSYVLARCQKKSGFADPIFRMFEHEAPFARQELAITSIASSGAISGIAVSNQITFDAATVIGLPVVGDAYVGLQFEVWDATRTVNKGQVVVFNCTAGSPNTLGVKEIKMSGDTNLLLVAGDIFTLIGDAQGDGSESPVAFHDELKLVWNQTQNFRTPILVKGALLDASLRGANNELARFRMQKAGEHGVKINKALLRGKSALGTNLAAAKMGDGNTEAFTEVNTMVDASGNVIRTTMGSLRAVDIYGSSTSSDDYQNIFDRSQGYKFSQFIDDMQKVMQFTPNTVRTGFCGPAARAFFSKINGDGKLKSQFGINLTDMKTNKLGVNIQYLETPDGVLELVADPSFKDRGYRNTIFIPEFENMFHASFTSPSFHNDILKDNRPKLVKDEYDSDEGVGLTLVKSHHIIRTPLA